MALSKRYFNRYIDCPEPGDAGISGHGKLAADGDLDIVRTHPERRRQAFFCVSDGHLLCSGTLARRVRACRHWLEFEPPQIDLEIIEGRVGDGITDVVPPNPRLFELGLVSHLNQIAHLVAIVPAVRAFAQSRNTSYQKRRTSGDALLSVTPVRFPATNDIFATVGLLCAYHPITRAALSED